VSIAKPAEATNTQGPPPDEAALGDPKGGAGPQSVTRVIRVLEALCDSARPLSLADLSRATGTPKSSLAALLRGLAEEHFVIAIDGAWRLGPGAFGLGSALVAARGRFPAAELVREGLKRLSERAGETVLFAVRDRAEGGGVENDPGTMTYVDAVECRNAVRFAVAIGDRRPLYATSGGRALLSARSDAEVARYLGHARPQRLTPRTETDQATLAAAIAAVRRDGYAQTVDQAADGVTGTAALVRDASGAAIGALVVAAPSQRTARRLVELAQLVAEEAATISRSLGFREPAQA
jgi:DNA-binding IclR family transcriptional regulator